MCPIGTRHEPAGGATARWRTDPFVPQGSLPVSVWGGAGSALSRGDIRSRVGVDILRRIAHFGDFPSSLPLARHRLPCWPETPTEPWEGSSPMNETVSLLPELPGTGFDATASLDALLADVGLSAADAGGRVTFAGPGPDHPGPSPAGRRDWDPDDGQRRGRGRDAPPPRRPGPGPAPGSASGRPSHQPQLRVGAHPGRRISVDRIGAGQPVRD